MADTDKGLAYLDQRIDRSVMLRADPAGVEALLKGGTARLVPVWNQRHLATHASDTGPRPRYLSFVEAGTHVDQAQMPPVFLGIMDDTPWFAVSVTAADTVPGVTEKDYRLLHDFLPNVQGAEASMLAYARGMVIWHQNHTHCGRCGSMTAATEGGHSRTCTNTTCNHRSFPRTDPAIITLIEHPDGAHCLLGRQASWPPGMYSTVAGFVEPGESLEAAVIREGREETGLVLGDVRYMGSQPWPFPSSIMLGFRARALTTEIKPDDQELEDCRWFTRDEARDLGNMDDESKPFRAPPTLFISRFLINSWVNEK